MGVVDVAFWAYEAEVIGILKGSRGDRGVCGYGAPWSREGDEAMANPKRRKGGGIRNEVTIAIATCNSFSE